MDNILPILLVIVWIIASVYQAQGKKKKQAERKSTSPRRSDSESTTEAYEQKDSNQSQGFLDKIFESLDSDFNDPYESFAQEMVSDEKSADTEVQYKEVQPGGEKPADKSSAPLKRKRPVKSPKKQEWMKNLAHDFDGKKAVIYSEILNRPYS